MSMKETLLAAGADKLADILLSLREKNKDVHREMAMIIAVLDENPKKISAAIRKEIGAFKRSVKFVNFKESAPVSERLDKLRQRIANDMFSKSPKIAFELMLEFLDLHEKTLERSDDSSNNIGQVFTSSCKDLGKISEKVTMPQSQLVEIVFSRCMKNRYCICNDIILHFANSLTNKGLLMLKDKFEQSVLSSGEDWTRSNAKYGLRSVADVMKDVDAYISACSITGETLYLWYPEIARRLIQHGRGQEALVWLDRDKTNTSSVYCKLRVQAFESIGEHDKAQTERLIWFDKNLEADVYRDILKAASAEFKLTFIIEAMQKALRYPTPRVSLLFLREVKELKNFIRLRHESLDGSDYGLLRPVAELVQSSDPLAATLIYRSMIGAILDKVKNYYYKHAAKDLVKCSILNRKITDWESFENHTEYLGGIQKTHKYKRRFWSHYELALSPPTPAKKRRKV